MGELQSHSSFRLPQQPPARREPQPWGGQVSAAAQLCACLAGRDGAGGLLSSPEPLSPWPGLSTTAVSS